METGQPPARPASALDAAMTRLQHAIVAVVMAGESFMSEARSVCSGRQSLREAMLPTVA